MTDARGLASLGVLRTKLRQAPSVRCGSRFARRPWGRFRAASMPRGRWWSCTPVSVRAARRIERRAPGGRCCCPVGRVRGAGGGVRGLPSMRITPFDAIGPARGVVRMPHMRATTLGARIASSGVFCRFPKARVHAGAATPSLQVPPLTSGSPTLTATGVRDQRPPGRARMPGRTAPRTPPQAAPKTPRPRPNPGGSRTGPTRPGRASRACAARCRGATRPSSPTGGGSRRSGRW